MRLFTYVLLIGFCSLAAVSITYNWTDIPDRLLPHRATQREQESNDLRLAEQQLASGQPLKALSLIKKYVEKVDQNTHTGKKWLALFIQANVETHNHDQLLALYQVAPKAFHQEQAALIVADSLIAAGKNLEYQNLRVHWVGKESQPEEWTLLDADNLLAQDKTQQAIELLQSYSLEGSDDTARLIRLAWLHLADNPKAAWEYLSQAQQKNPNNPDIYAYRAKALEGLNKKTLAESEYLAAIHSDPSNLYLKDQLAQFYLRNKEYPKALQAWAEALNPPSQDFIWENAIFWNKMITPLALNWRNLAPPQGKLRPYVDYLLSLPPGKYWDNELFNTLPQAYTYLKNEQSTFWLRLINALKHRDEQEAWELLENNHFHATSWDPQLEKGLKHLLIYRKMQALAISNGIQILNHPYSTYASKEHFFEHLHSLAMSPEKKKVKISRDLHTLLTSHEAYTALFLAAGWWEAALQLLPPGEVTIVYPNWIAYELTLALQANRGPSRAVQFAQTQVISPRLALLLGELQITLEDDEAALEQLSTLMKDQTEIGYRAAWLSSLLHIEREEYHQAKEAILMNADLTAALSGREALARIAFLEGNTQEAERLYGLIQQESSEAMSFLARKAFEEKDWKKALGLTKALLKKHPANPTLQANLDKLLHEQPSS